MKDGSGGGSPTHDFTRLLHLVVVWPGRQILLLFLFAPVLVVLICRLKVPPDLSQSHCLLHSEFLGAQKGVLGASCRRLLRHDRCVRPMMIVMIGVIGVGGLRCHAWLPLTKPIVDTGNISTTRNGVMSRRWSSLVLSWQSLEHGSVLAHISRHLVIDGCARVVASSS